MVAAQPHSPVRFVVLICADAEWRPAKTFLNPAHVERSPYGEFFVHRVADEPLLFLNGGWGKIAAAASTEYAISRWQPQLLINLGTCGGIEGRVSRGQTVLVTRTVTYDIGEGIGDSQEAIDAYSTEVDLSWIDDTFPIDVRRAHLISADRDLVPAEVPTLVQRYSAVAADWESSAIAHVARRREVRVLILRAVSDLVNPHAGEVIGDLGSFEQRAAKVMHGLLGDLPRLVPYLAQRLPR